MIGKNWLTEAINKNTILNDRFNVVKAPAGSGKTTLALEFGKLGRVLLLEDHTATVESIARKNAQNVEVMTYQKFGEEIRRGINIFMWDYVICDEIHHLAKPITIERANYKKMGFNSDITEALLKTNCSSYIALNTINVLCDDINTIVLGMSATPNAFESATECRRLVSKSNKVEVSEDVYQLTENRRIAFSSPQTAKNELTADKSLIFINSIDTAIKWCEDLREMGRSPQVLWSIHNKQKCMSGAQKVLRDYILVNEVLPEDVSDIIITEAYDTGINLKDPKIQTVIVYNSNEDTIEQVRGRVRHDIDLLMYHVRDNKEAKQQQRDRLNEQKNEAASGIVVPEKYLNGQFIDKAMLLSMIEELGLTELFTDKKTGKLQPTKFKQALETNYKVESARKKNQRGYYIIPKS